MPFKMKPNENFPIVFHVFEVPAMSKLGVSLSNADLILFATELKSTWQNEGVFRLLSKIAG